MTTATDLKLLEQKFGGMVRGVRRRKVSRVDPRTEVQLKAGGMQGGDRMGHHDYAEVYAPIITSLQEMERPVVVELGILCGHGLALLCEALPDARIIGLDVDVSHYQENREALKARGAFAAGEPEVYSFDQLQETDYRKLSAALKGTGIDLWIDDALHMVKPVMWTIEHALPFMEAGFRYVVEDTEAAASYLANRYGKRYDVHTVGRITVVSDA